MGRPRVEPLVAAVGLGFIRAAVAAAPTRSRWALAAGASTTCLVGICVASAWTAGSPLRAGAATLTPGHGVPRLFVPALVGAFAAYLLALLLIRRGHVGVRAAIVIAVAIQLVPLSGPLLGSTDAWSYWDYARTAAVHGANPYVLPPSAFPHDAAYRYVGAAWHGTTSAYGPAFTLASEPVALAAGTSATAAAWAFKTLAALAVLVAALLAGMLARRGAFAIAFVGWNPLLALDFAGGGHNDALMAVLVLTALVLSAADRGRLASVAWAASIFVKWVTLLLLPLHLLAERASGRPIHRRALLASLAGGALIASAAFGPAWLRAATPLAHVIDHGSRFAIPVRLESLGVPRWAALSGIAGAFAAAYAFLLRSAARGRARLGLASGLLLLAAPYLVSWYVIWAVPLAAAEEDGAAQLLSLGLCAYLLRQGIRT